MAKGSANLSACGENTSRRNTVTANEPMKTQQVFLDLERFHLSPNKQCQSIHDDQWRGERYTTVRALVLGRFSQKKLKIELKDNAKNE